ncbi:MAG: hypothetical protein K2W80_13030 [Burkholderiales bacterium]|nr:hypothetical protein [Burkholderiales bacterium]
MIVEHTKPIMKRARAALLEAIAAGAFSLALALPALAASPESVSYPCTFGSGAVVKTPYPCEPAMVAAFTSRLLELYPAVARINTDPDYMLGLYSFAMAGCRGQFATMTPEAIGLGGEPFFPKEMLAAMIRAGREVMCPEPVAGIKTDPDRSP